MNNPLRIALKVENNMLPNPIHALDPPPGKRLHHLTSISLKRLRLRPQPHRLNDIPMHPLVHPIRNRLDFRKFRHNLYLRRTRNAAAHT